MTDKQQIKRGTSAQWSATAKALASKQLGYDTDLDIFKMGDGSTLWGSLPGMVAGPREILTRKEVTRVAISSTVAVFATGLTGLTPSTFFEISVVNVPHSSAQTLRIQTSVDDGSTYKTGASDYYRAALNSAADSTVSDNHINVGTGQTGAHTAKIWIYHLNDPLTETSVVSANMVLSGGTSFVYQRSGDRQAKTAEDAFKIFVPSGNMTSGDIVVYQYDSILVGI